MIPDLLAIGHVTRDLGPDGVAVGGAAAYGALTALHLGLAPAVATSAQPGVVETLAGVEASVVPSSSTTTFRNLYRAGRRSQSIESVANRISVDAIPLKWRAAPIVLVAPVANEIDHAVVRLFPNSIVVASLQGWLRRWGADGIVRPRPWDGLEVLPYVDAAVVSREDTGGEGEIERWARLAHVLIETLGPHGARLHAGGAWRAIPAFPAREVDPTGAGDVFAASYAVNFRDTQDPLEAARFASAAASLSVQGEGTTAIPTQAEVQRRLFEA